MYFSGLIRCMAVSLDSQWVAVGFSSGIMSLLNLKTGMMLGTWKGHEGEIIQVLYCLECHLIPLVFFKAVLNIATLING